MLLESRVAKALIIKRRARREVDLEVSAYVQGLGKLNFIARGALKEGSKLAGHLEPFNFVEILILPGKNHNYIASALTLSSFYSLKNDLNRLYFAGQAWRAFDSLVSLKQIDDELFNLLLSYLLFLDGYQAEFNQKVGRFYYDFFLLKLFAGLGLSPSLNNCVACGKGGVLDSYYFDLSSGALVCDVCRLKMDPMFVLSLSEEVLFLVRMSGKKDFNFSQNFKVSAKTAKELSVFVKAFALYYFDNISL